jgi:hypothetical protein
VLSSDTILLPVINGMCSTFGEDDPKYRNDLFCEYVYRIIPSSYMYARWDGVDIPIQRIQSNRDFIVQGYYYQRKPVKWFADGFWVVIKDPEPGTHTIEVGLTVTDFNVGSDPPGTPPLCPNVKYTIIVT